MNQQKIGEFLKHLRKDKGLTQEQLAEHFYVSSRTVSRWETGSNLPDLSILMELSEFYDVDIRELINGERKNEYMTVEMKDTLESVVDYTEAEKESILKSHFACIVISEIIFLALYIIILFNLNNKNEFLESITTILPFWGLISSGSGFVSIMQIKGQMGKNRLKKIRKISLPIISLLLIMIIIVILIFAA